MNAVIIVVFVMPILQLVLGKLKKSNKREGYTGTIYLPTAYQQVLLWCMVIAVACGAVLCLRFGVEEVKDILGIAAGLIVIIELVRLSFRRYKVVVSGEGLEITPYLGRKRSVKFSEIDLIEETAMGDLKIVVRGKRIGRVDEAAVGYKEFRRLMEQKGLLEQVADLEG